MDTLGGLDFSDGITKPIKRVKLIHLANWKSLCKSYEKCLFSGKVKVLKQLESEDIKILAKQFGALSMEQPDVGEAGIELMVNG